MTCSTTRSQQKWNSKTAEAKLQEVLQLLPGPLGTLALVMLLLRTRCHAARSPSLVEGSHIIPLVDEPSWAHGQQPASPASIVSDPSWTCIPGEPSDGSGTADIWPQLREKCCVELLGWAQSLHGTMRDSNTLLVEVTKGLFVTQCHATVRYYFRAISHYTPRENTTSIQLKHSY